MTDLTGKRVLVTGGAVRAGAVFCRAFAARGARIVIHCRNSRTAADALCAELGGTDAGHVVTVCDLCDSAAAEEMIRVFRPDVLVNSAAVYERATLPVESTTVSESQFRVNFAAPAAMIRTLAEVRGTLETAVVNVLDAGIAGVDPASFSYALSKKLLAEATRAAALQCAPFLRVNAVAPGHMIPPPALAARGMAKTAARLPLCRAVSPDDVAEAVVFLACNRSVTGAVLFVDCGQSLAGYYSQAPIG